MLLHRFLLTPTSLWQFVFGLCVGCFASSNAEASAERTPISFWPSTADPGAANFSALGPIHDALVPRHRVLLLYEDASSRSSRLTGFLPQVDLALRSLRPVLDVLPVNLAGDVEHVTTDAGSAFPGAALEWFDAHELEPGSGRFVTLPPAVLAHYLTEHALLVALGPVDGLPRQYIRAHSAQSLRHGYDLLSLLTPTGPGAQVGCANRDDTALAKAEEWHCPALASRETSAPVFCDACAGGSSSPAERVAQSSSHLGAVLQAAIERRPRDPNRDYQLATALLGAAEGRAVPSDDGTGGALWSKLGLCRDDAYFHGAFSCVLDRVTCCDHDGALIVHRSGLRADVLHKDGIVGRYRWAAPEPVAVRETAVPYARSECAVTVGTGVLWAAGNDENLGHLFYESLPALFWLGQHVRGDGHSPLLLRYRRRFFQRLTQRAQQELMAMFTAAPIDLSFQDIRWRGKAVCFERLVALSQPFDPAPYVWAALRRGFRRFDAFYATLIGSLRDHLTDLSGAKPSGKRTETGDGEHRRYAIVLSERDSSRRRLTNQAELGAWFAARALHVVNFGALGLRKAIDHIVTNDVRVLVGLFGTDIFVNALFMRPDSVVISLWPHIPNAVWLHEFALPPPCLPRCAWSSTSAASCAEPVDALAVLRGSDPLRVLALGSIHAVQWRDPTGALTRHVGTVPLLHDAPAVSTVRVRDGYFLHFYADVALPTRTLERLLAEAADLVDLELCARKRVRIAQDDELFGHFGVGDCDC
jgi:hypothetical protein